MKISRMAKLTILIAAILGSQSGCRTIRQPRLHEPMNRTEAWTQDLTYLQKEFPKHNRSFDEASLSRFNEILTDTRRSVTDISDNDIYVRLLQAVATADDVHTSMNLMPSSGKLRRIPIRFYWFSDGLHVIKTNDEHTDLLGARVEAIAGVKPETIRRQMRNIIPGSESYLSYESVYYLSSPDFLHGMGLLENPDSMAIRFKRQDGMVINRTIASQPMGPKIWGYNSWRELSPISTESMDSTGYTHILDGIELPVYLTHPNQSSFFQSLADDSVLYIQVNQNTNLGIAIKEITEDIEETLSSGDFDSVIVDLRFNTGGNLLNTTKLVKGIPAWHTGIGKIYIIVGGPTFSAGIVTAARLKFYSGDRSVIVGEPAAEGLQFWAETRFFTLPNSDLRFYAAFRYHNWETTNYDRGKRHFWLMKRVGVPAGDLDVDMPVSVSMLDYLTGRDPVVDRILEEVLAEFGE